MKQQIWRKKGDARGRMAKCAKQSQTTGQNEAETASLRSTGDCAKQSQFQGRGPWDCGLPIADCGLEDGCLQ